MYEELMPGGPTGNLVPTFPQSVETQKNLYRDVKSSNNTKEISNCLWYHFKLRREEAQAMVVNDGDFLLRQSLSSVDDYVLTLRWNATVLHFKINKFVQRHDAVNSSTFFVFERAYFDSIYSLIMYHMENQIPISVLTGALIQHPITRQTPAVGFNERQTVLRMDAHGTKENNSNVMKTEKEDKVPPLNVVTKFDIPPKPSRVPSFRKPVIRHGSGTRSATGKSLTKSVTSKKGEDKSEILQERSSALNVSKQQPDNSKEPVLSYVSNILQTNNKPLDSQAMAAVKKILLQTDPFKIAKHITYHDYKICEIHDNGLEKMIFPVGSKLRKLVLERYQCLAFWVAITILSGSQNVSEMVDMLNIFIQVANELVHSLGNVFGFSALMHGLLCPQMLKIIKVWALLQQRYTNNSVTLFKKLNPLLKLLDEGKGQISLESTCIPHIVPMLRFLENPLTEIPHYTNKTNVGSSPSVPKSTKDPQQQEHDWWKNIPDDSFDGMLAQLNVTRTNITSRDLFQKTTQSKIFVHGYDTGQSISEILSTEFHMRLLFGQKGVESAQWERYAKFDRLITLIAQRI
uniref:breast cancer anti-estrogen resistance protein 3-like isoform X1 n=1 Tax=Ciona intestinalis TaxID=7719 RepID=UPI00006A5E95|nr:breast cancer anti-estrogen resistance protein 3-like isoform X1 [Ciona intestinalis]|eukprot:XP_002130488.1 breast cancer anti-estrogen resistance protein 3-like isoform X1 [Ciona intestinalis]